MSFRVSMRIVIAVVFICGLLVAVKELTGRDGYRWRELTLQEALTTLGEAASDTMRISPIGGQAADTTIDGDLYMMVMRFSIRREDLFAIADAFDMEWIVHDPFNPSVFPGGPGHQDDVPSWFARWQNSTWYGVGEDSDIIASGIVARNYQLSFLGLRAEESEHIVIYLDFEIPVFVKKRNMAAERGGSAIFYTSFEGPKESE